MSLKIIRDNIVNLKTDAIVNTANEDVAVGTGCDHAIYSAAGHEKLLEFRKNKIGKVEEGKVFVTPSFDLKSKYIIHVVSPKYIDGMSGEEEKLRNCYKRSLELAKEYGVKSIAYPVVSTGSFGYPKEEGINIAVEEINAFLNQHSMEVFLVVFDDESTKIGKIIYPELEEYINSNYVNEKAEKSRDRIVTGSAIERGHLNRYMRKPTCAKPKESVALSVPLEEAEPYEDFEMVHGSKLDERMKHISDTFSEYLLYIIKDKNMTNSEVYNRALVSKKVFSKIKNNKDYHPQKITALCLCVGAKLNMDETRDMLRRAGYALSPCDKTDIIFSYFIENEIYDMIELDIQLEEHGLPCILL
ncbi:MAG: RNase III inhibitor [Lachnospiraceae bacterium]|nr:RNase III inhibitor [Lachnospiraceae bacterium]